MTTTEERLRTLFQDMAEEARPAVLLSRLDDREPVVRRRRVVIVVAAAAAAVAVAVSTVFVESRLSSMPQPAYDPPAVFELPQEATARPGIAALAVSLTDAATVSVVPAGDTASVSVVGSDSGSPWPARLSSDGTRLVIVYWAVPAAVEVLDLTTGEGTRLDVATTYAAEVSPDNQMVAVYLKDGVQLLDLPTGESTAVIGVRPHRELDSSHPALGWSPDGMRLALHEGDDLVIVDRQGVEQVRRSAMNLVNSSQSWSPDSRSLLVFDVQQSRFVVQPVDDGDPTSLTAPADAVRPMGWAGDRVVWLAGQPGAQRLVAANPDGGDAETWMRFDVGNVPVESVTWSRDLSG